VRAGMSEEHKELLGAIRGMCERVGRAVRPLLGTDVAKGIEGHGASGDVTFMIDEIAEREVASFLDERGNVAYYTEDRGLTVVGSPQYLLVIDPIDGTRPAAAGLESCCVSVAVAPFAGNGCGSLTLGDVFLGVVSEIKNDAFFSAVRGCGVSIDVNGLPVSSRLSGKADAHDIFWTLGFRGRPAEPLITVLGELVDLTSVDGGCFDLGSATFCITRVVTGEMDVYVDVGQRMADEVDAVRERFLEIGHGAILNNYPYDLAAAALVASESGACVTDAYGRPLDGYPLVPRDGEGQISAVISANRLLHEQVLRYVDIGMKRLAGRYGGRREE